MTGSTDVNDIHRTVVTVAALAATVALGLAGVLPGEAVAGIIGVTIPSPLRRTREYDTDRP